MLVEITQTPDIHMALTKVLTEYLELKIRELQERIAVYEEKWNLSFDEFSTRCQNKNLGQDIYSYEVERDFWEWERLESLRKHYVQMKSQWM